MELGGVWVPTYRNRVMIFFMSETYIISSISKISKKSFAHQVAEYLASTKRISSTKKIIENLKFMAESFVLKASVKN